METIARRVVLIFLVVATASCLAACSDPEHESPPLLLPMSSGPAPSKPAPEPTADTAGTIPVKWSAVSGKARQDPIGLLDSTPILRDATGMHAAKTVDFVPTAPDATSATGRYEYRLDMTENDVIRGDYHGTMSIVWTMTIVRAASQSDFNAEYSATVSATYSELENKILVGLAKGTADTVDTFTAGTTKERPLKRTAAFAWRFATP